MNTVFAVLLGAGVLITLFLVLLNAVARPPRKRRKLPADEGFPRAPLGAPYRGPFN